VIYRYDSPQVFSFFATNVPITSAQKLRDPGYARPPTTQTLFFGDRGSGTFEAQHLVDFALNYELPVWKTASPWFKVEVRNAFDKQPLIGFNTTITPDAAGPVDSLGLPINYVRGPNFGKGTQNSHYPIPREFFVSVGFRF